MNLTEKISVFVADHRSAVLTGLCQWFDSQERYRTIGAATDVHQMFAALSQQTCDLIVMGSDFCGDDFVILRELRRCLPHVPIVVFTAINEPNALRAMLFAGATGIIGADDEMKDFERVCSRVMSGAPGVMSHRVAALCEEVAAAVPQSAPQPRLQTAPQPELQTAPQPEPQLAPQPEPQLAPQPELQTAPQLAPQPKPHRSFDTLSLYQDVRISVRPDVPRTDSRRR